VNRPFVERLFAGFLFRFTDLFTGRRMMLFERRHPRLYLLAVVPPLIVFVILFLLGLAWWNGNLRF
jgi:hypothetical protein